jgi:hypothetical protein
MGRIIILTGTVDRWTKVRNEESNDSRDYSGLPVGSSAQMAEVQSSKTQVCKQFWRSKF